MDSVLFSSTLPKFSKKIENKSLRSSLAGVSVYLKKTLTPLSWNENHIAIPITVPVDLPTLGNDRGIDIREKEDVLIVINHKSYPNVVPIVLTDRLDFPKAKIAHLYYEKKGRPPAFCVVRGSLKEWYANKRLVDLIIRTQNWLRDAACGELTENNDQFDPLRIETSDGTTIYDYDSIADIVLQNKIFSPDDPFGVVLFEGAVTESTGITFKLHTIVTPDNFMEVRDMFDVENKKGKNLHYGYIIWSQSDMMYDDYDVDFPSDLEGFRTFAEKYGINLGWLEDSIASVELNTKILFPVILGIRRPKNLIGFSRNIEFINFRFRVDSPDVNNGTIINNIPITLHVHNQPLTVAKARQISDTPPLSERPFIVFGCGALGSKIVMHLARSGMANCVLVDSDNFAPHNQVRHVLSAKDIGINKAKALGQQINDMYPQESTKLAIPLPIDGETLLMPEALKNLFWSFDFTASPSFSNAMVNMGDTENVRIVKGYLSDTGNLGILVFEGEQRAVRIDDAQQYLYYQAAQDSYIAGWLERERDDSKKILVNVGIGCNSETFLLADDIVGMHAATFSRIIKSEAQKPFSENGILYLSIVAEDGFSHSIRSIPVPTFLSIRCKNDSRWEIRIRETVLKEMRLLMSKALPKETGGVFIGSVNFKTNTIHILDIVKAPSDSESNEVCFYRGVSGLSEEIDKISSASAGQIGYIGEWHTHPEGPEGMSVIDAAAVISFKKDFIKQSIPLPVFLMILTPTNTLAFTY